MNDPLSDALRHVRLSGAVFLDVEMTEPWCVTSAMTAEDARGILREPAQLVFYHVVTEGSMTVTVGNEAPVVVGAGEIVILTRNDEHVLASGRELAPIPAQSLVRPGESGGISRVRHGGGGRRTRLYCGFLGSDGTVNPLLSGLPRMLKIGIAEAASRDWVEASVRFAAEALVHGTVATGGVMSRLSEVLLVEAVRSYAAGLGQADRGWLRGFADPRIGRALARSHGRGATPVTIADLAREAGMSRSGFVERFTDLVGMPTIRYVTEWRIHAAMAHLAETRAGIEAIAFAAGYSSPEAFSRAFKRATGIAPADWRAQAAGAAAGGAVSAG